ncbi:MAG: hypothetical protein ACOY93_04465 [Bacillota bacterium]
MQDWDRLVVVLFGAGVAIYSGYGGWRFWQQQNRGAAYGSIFLALVSVLLPLLLAVQGG